MIISKPYNKAGEETWDRVFGKTKKVYCDNNHIISGKHRIQWKTINGRKVCDLCGKDMVC